MIEEARVLRQAGHFVEALTLYREALDGEGSYDQETWLEYADTALLACGAERSRPLRQQALEALVVLQSDSTLRGGGRLGEMWRRLAWEMIRDRDSLQAYAALESSLVCSDMVQAFEEEWLFRGVYASRHLSLVSALPDSLAMTPAGDSILAVSAEGSLVELSRIPMMRTDLRDAVLQAKALLLPYTDRRAEELEVLTELDRMGAIDPALRERRMRLLITGASEDIEQGRAALAREKLLEVWDSDYASDRVEAALLLGIMAEGTGRSDEALDWYRSACNAAPGLGSPAALEAAARRDSLMFLQN
jgi:tetratricopeptide (TPR) repeat protein